ncbi:MAG: mechanosensitive ion channel family protein [Myxococcota bacterium]|nr:mechanosensitive ion channel family protein [Myxococcota bacterium]
MDALFSSYFTDHSIRTLVEVIITTVLFLMVSRFGIIVVARACRGRFGVTGALLIQRMLWYPLLILVVSNALSRLGFDTSVLLGAAGVLTVAAGFAAQTSAANIISGLFLLGERPFAVGDVIQFEHVTGTVVSIDLLSVKLCTFDNLLVRLPNEVVLKKKLTNLSHFKIRRVDVPIHLARTADFNRAIEILRRTAGDLPHCLDEPEPIIIYDSFSASGQRFKFCIWGQASEFLVLKNTFNAQANHALLAAEIELAVQPVSIRYEAADTAPIQDI